MRFINFIEDQEVIKTIFKHLGLWLVKGKPPPMANAPPTEFQIDRSDAQFPSSDGYLYRDPEYSVDVCAS